MATCRHGDLPTVTDPSASIPPATTAPPAAPAAAPLAAAAAAPPSWARSVLHEDDDILLELATRTPPGNTLAVTFDPIMVGLDQPAYAVDFLHRAGVDTLAVRKKHEHFYQPLSRERFEQLAAPVLQRYSRRVAYGSSLGAYAVLYFCQHGFDAVIASSPRVSAHPRFGADPWQRRISFQHQAFDPEQPATSSAVVFYDPHDTQDRHLVDDELRPAWPRGEFRAVPFAGHPANQFLAEIGFIAPFVRAMVQGQPPPPLDRRPKRRSGMYHQVLATACLQHRKLRWAHALATRALQLSPHLALAGRTLGEVLLAMDRLDEAELHLQAFAKQNPADGISYSALKRLEARRAALARAAGSAQGMQTSSGAAARAVHAAAAGIGSPAAAAIAAGTAANAVAGPPASSTAATSQAGREAAPATAAVETDGAADAPLSALRRRVGRWLDPDTPWGARGRRWALWLHQRLRGRGAITREDVVWCYRHFLGRDPESEAVIQHHLLHGSLREMAQAFIQSPEHARRLQAAAARPGAAVHRASAFGRKGPVILVALNCQAPGVAAALRCLTDASDVIPVAAGTIPDEQLHQQIAAHAARADLWFTSPGNRVALDLYAQHKAGGARLVTLPLIHFTAFHPDVCYAGSRKTQALARQPYNSAIAVWAYRQGLDAAATAELFNRRTYEALGYLDSWPAAEQALRKAFEASDLRARWPEFWLHVQRLGCFMHTPNHPQVAVLAHLARLAAQQAGLPLRNHSLAPGELTDGLASVIWPLYPEIAHELALDGGSTVWKLVGAHQYLDGVQAFVEHSFAGYEAQGIARADLEPRFFNAARLDEVLGGLTGRGADHGR